MKKILPSLGILALLLLSAACLFHEFLPAIPWNPILPTGPVTMAVAIEESGDRAKHRDQTEALMGKTSQALRKADKFRLYDAKDSKGNVHLPDAAKALYATIKDTDLPYLWLYHGKSAPDWKGPVPAGVKAFDELIQKEGGY